MTWTIRIGRSPAVADPDEEQALRRGGRAGLAAVLGGDASATLASGQRPTPTRTSVPVIARTMLYRKPSASTSTRTTSPIRLTARWVIVRTLLVRLGQLVSKLWKSCRPTSACAARCIAATSSGW